MRTIIFIKKWGEKSWLVRYDGPYANDMPPHVELGKGNMDTVKAGQVAMLSDLRKVIGAYMWTVGGVKNGGGEAHFTVAFGDKGPLPDVQ